MSYKDLDSKEQLAQVGEIFWRVGKNDLYQVTIERVEQLPHFVYRDSKGNSYFNRNFKTTLFRTLKEASDEQMRRRNIALKRTMLREYEKELNKKYNIEGHYIVK